MLSKQFLQDEKILILKIIVREEPRIIQRLPMNGDFLLGSNFIYIGLIHQNYFCFE